MQQFRSVLAKMCEIVPNLEKNRYHSLLLQIICGAPVEQHGNELDDNDGKEEEHENNSNGFKVQVLFGDDDLGKMNSLMKKK